MATEWLQEELGLGDLVSPDFQHSLGRLPQEPPPFAAWAGVRWGLVSQQSQPHGPGCPLPGANSYCAAAEASGTR